MSTLARAWSSARQRAWSLSVSFARIELVELVFGCTRQHEDWDLDEIMAGVPALAVVAAWFAVRRRREAVQRNVRLEHTVARLHEEIQRRAPSPAGSRTS